MGAALSVIWMLGFGAMTARLWRRARVARASDDPRAPHLQRLVTLSGAAAIFGLSSLLLALGLQFTSS